jgi:hypothetical protein
VVGVARLTGLTRRRPVDPLVIAVLLALAGCSGSGEPGQQQPGIGDPGGPPSVEGPRPRGNLQKQPIGSVVLAAGRAPDGARYEFVLETFAEPTGSDPSSEDFGKCLNLEWPDARVGQISPEFGCHPEFPPAAVDEAVVKRGGAIFDPSYTTQVQIAGLARSGVGDVRILYKDEHGAKHDAPVHFANVTGEVQERAGADRPLGVFIGFLPQAWLGYGASYDPRHCAPEEHPYEPEAIEVIAYDRQGEAIATETGNNIASVGGRPSCP